MAHRFRDSASTIQERVATTHVRSLNIDVDAMASVSNMFRITVAFRTIAEKKILKGDNLSFSGFTVLWVLWVFGKKEPYELAGECGIAKGTLTGVVSTLEKNGLVRRTGHASDGRRKVVLLTRRGSTLIKRLFLQLNALEKEFVSALQKSEINALNHTMRIILHTAEHSEFGGENR